MIRIDGCILFCTSLLGVPILFVEAFFCFKIGKDRDKGFGSVETGGERDREANMHLLGPTSRDWQDLCLKDLVCATYNTGLNTSLMG